LVCLRCFAAAVIDRPRGLINFPLQSKPQDGDPILRFFHPGLTAYHVSENGAATQAVLHWGIKD
jgi:hypothetical protein